MADHRFESIAIPIVGARNRELRVQLGCDGAPEVELAIFRDPRATGADASVRLTRDGALALVHALDTALEREGAPRRPATEAPARPSWWIGQARAA